MSSRRFIRLMATLILVPLVAIVGISRAQAYYRCVGDLVARKACCCPTVDRAVTPRSENPSVESACCCSIELLPAAEAPRAEPQPRHVELGASSDVVVSVGTLHAALPVARPAPVPHLHRYNARPPTTESLFSQHVALLL